MAVRGIRGATTVESDDAALIRVAAQADGRNPAPQSDYRF